MKDTKIRLPAFRKTFKENELSKFEYWEAIEGSNFKFSCTRTF